ncbi:MAG TPA: hypothetical protein VN840_12560, partial [Streptosporangiaceae bacterium]|nr:hypothetical protein [Streptosporangiaceae bacterium]
MNPPSEQLIRDYLNRMSVAARRKLGFRDRQALLDRTRMQIEVACGGPGAASAAQVRKVLAGFGDPVAVVESEHARITAGPDPAVGPESNGVTRSGAPAARFQEARGAPAGVGRPALDEVGGTHDEAAGGAPADAPGASAAGGVPAGGVPAGGVPAGSVPAGSVP